MSCTNASIQTTGSEGSCVNVFTTGSTLLCDWKFVMGKDIIIHVNISSWVSSNSEANASEQLENFEFFSRHR